MEQFYTIGQEIVTDIIEKKSKFISHFIPIENIEDAEEKIKRIRKQYFDAKHHCVAYRIIENGQVVEKASDDGEPSGTAGGPMLHILQKNELLNILIVVTRYFGGILLGTGGLVRAYSDSLLKALEISNKLEICKGIEWNVVLDYSEFENFKYYCKKQKINIENVEYAEDIFCNIEMELSKKERFVHDYEIKNIILKEIQEISIKYIKKSI